MLGGRPVEHGATVEHEAGDADGESDHVEATQPPSKGADGQRRDQGRAPANTITTATSEAR